MILHKLRDHIQAQNWFAVGIDIVVVVLGVYIGIFLGDTAEKRSLHEKTLETLAVIHNQLEIDLANVDRIAAYREEKLNEPRQIIKILSQTPADHHALAPLIYQLHKRLYTFFPKQSGYSTLQDRGYLAIIEDKELQLKLANLYDEVYVRNKVVADESDSHSFNYDREFVGIYWSHDEQVFIGDPNIARPRLLNAAYKNLSNSEWVIQFLREIVRPAIVETMTAIEAYRQEHGN